MAIRRSVILITLILWVMLGFPGVLSAGEEAGGRVRASILAGSWYPANPDRLAQTIQGYLAHAKGDQASGDLKALIVPHAGYTYSGQVAAYAYRLLQDRLFRKVIMVGPSHRVSFEGVSVNLQEGYETPLGTVPVDRGLAQRLITSRGQIRWVPEAHAQEHSLEIQLPFLQCLLPDFQIVPILMGQQDFSTCSMLAETLAGQIKHANDILVLASSDLSHFHAYDRARELDMAFVEQVRRFDPLGLSQALAAGRAEACGGGPSITVLLASRTLGADRAMILKYANSGDVTGDHRRVVGYMSAALYKSR
jgi:hypothetical protein